MPNATGEHERPYTAPETWKRAHEHPDAKRPFPEVLQAHMDHAGIEDLEELWERFEEVGGENIQRWRFMRSCEGTYGRADARVIRGVVRVFGYPFDSEGAARLALSFFGMVRRKAH
jgi:hypothetical protein